MQENNPGRKIIPPHGGKRKGYGAEIRQPRKGGIDGSKMEK